MAEPQRSKPPLFPISIPQWLRVELDEHARAHTLYYRGVRTDHLPMMLLAMHGTGSDEQALRTYAAHYRARLRLADGPMPPAPADWRSHVGDRGAYRRLLAYFDRAIAARGPLDVVHEVLPTLISGWAGDAYHAVIRLAYGLRFGCATEISAGLAYLAACGPDPRLAEQVAKIEPSSSLPRPEPVDGLVFQQKYNTVVGSGRIPRTAGALPREPAGIAGVTLDCFNATHDFFALHLVTGTHAFLVCADYVTGDHTDLLRAGIAAGLLAIGAPAFERDTPTTPATIDDEHDTKLTFACADLAEMLANERLHRAAAILRTPVVSSEAHRDA